MRKVILIGGDLASGKSTYVKFIRDHFNLTIISKDNLKEILGDKIPTHNREENLKLSVISFEMIKYFLRNSSCDVAVECNFKPHEMVQLESILSGDDVLSLRFTGDDEILHRRFMNRLNNNRHFVHKSQDLSNISDYIKVQEELRSVKYIGEVIDVYVTDYDVLTDDIELLEKIDKFLKK